MNRKFDLLLVCIYDFMQVIGILNFCEDGRHQFGQGVIFYARNEIVNWITTISDSLR